MKWFFDQLTGVLHAAAPSVYTFIETTLPYTTPIPIATISSTSANTFFGLTGFPAFALVYSLEAIGLVTTTKLVDTVIDAIRSRNWKTWVVVVLLVATLLVYINILVNMNVNIHTDYTPAKAKVLRLLSFLPMIAGILNGLGLFKLKAEKKEETQAQMDERHRQEQLELEEKRRKDQMEFERQRLENERLERQDARRLRVDAQLKLAEIQRQQAQPAPTPQPQGERQPVASDYKVYVMRLLDLNNGNVPLTEITNMVNQDNNVALTHAAVKGTWYKYVQEWKRNHP